MARREWDVYREQMECQNLGDALWEPAPPNGRTIISLGDVGFTREGRFHLLFSACLRFGQYTPGRDVPSTFEPLIVGETKRDAPRVPGYLAATTLQRAGLPDFTEPFKRPVQAAEAIDLELTGYRGAALITGDQTLREDAVLLNKFAEYTKHHYWSWVEFSRDKQYGDVEPVLVYGFDKTRSHEMMAYSRHHTSAEVGVTISAPTFGSADVTRGDGFITDCPGPYFKRHLVQPGPPTEPDQYVFIRYYTMRPRPENLSSGDTSSEVAVESDADRMIVDEDPKRHWVVVRNVKYDEGCITSWDRISRYVFENSIAKSVLMHHKDLEGIRAMGNEADIAHLLEVHKPGINVDEDGVGRIIFGEGVISSHPATMDPPLNENLGEDDHDTTGSMDVSPDALRQDPPLHTSTSRTILGPPWLNDIGNLDENSPDIEQRLTAAFDANDYSETIHNLEERGIEPQSYINKLDRVFGSLPDDSDIQRRCLRALRKTCGIYGILPGSYALPYEIKYLGDQRGPVAGGVFGDVYKVTDENETGIFAAKVPRFVNNETRKAFCKEAVILKRLNHPNVLSIEGVASNLLDFCMVSRWMEHGDILTYVQKNPEVNRLELLIGVANGLNYLHSNEVAHRDLKCLNILVDREGIPHISDYGISSISHDPTVNDSTPNSSTTGRYLAPEFVDDAAGGKKKSLKQADIYSLSMVIVEVVTGERIFQGHSADQVASMALRGIRPPRPSTFVAPGTSKAVWEVADKCWNKKPGKRPEAGQVLQYLNDIKYGGGDKPTIWQRVLRRGPGTSN